MGIYIHLDVNPNGISGKKWERVYEESLRLLRAFPVPLMRFTTERARGRTRFVWTSSIVEEEGQSGEYWEIGGDLSTNLRAEEFRLYRGLDCHAVSRKELPAKDILLAQDEMNSLNGVSFFHNKTQGCPYHLAVLAVAILVESRFPRRAHATGDIDREQAEEVIRWADSVLDEPLTMPVCLDGERLYKRLAALHAEPAKVFEQFDYMFRGEEPERFEVLARNAGVSAVFEDLKQDMSGYKNLNQIGATALLGRFLRATDDPARLIEMIAEVNKSKRKAGRFPMSELFRICYRRFSGPAKPPRAPKRARIKTQDDLMSDFVMMMSGRDDPEYWIARDRLLKAFTAAAPELRNEFDRIMKEEDAKRPKPVPRAVSEPEPDSPRGRDYIVEQIELQREVYDDDDQVFPVIGEQLGQLVRKDREFATGDRAYCLDMISAISEVAGLSLRAPTWARIDSERNIDILRRLTMLAAIKNDEARFCDLRKRILETPDSWPLLLVNK